LDEMTGRRSLPAVLAALLLACLPAAAAADPYLPPEGKVWNGLTAGFDTGDFEARAGKHPAIWQHFVAWGDPAVAAGSARKRRDRSVRSQHRARPRDQTCPLRPGPSAVAARARRS
jgi:hypothetical protein